MKLPRQHVESPTICSLPDQRLSQLVCIGVRVVDESMDGQCFKGETRLEEAARTCAQSTAWLKAQEPKPPSMFESLAMQLQQDFASLRQRLTNSRGGDWKSSLSDLAGAAVSIAMILLLARFLVAKGLQQGARTEAANRLFDRLEHNRDYDNDDDDSIDGNDDSSTTSEKAMRRRCGSEGEKAGAQPVAKRGRGAVADAVLLDAEEGPGAVRAAAAYAAEMRRRARPPQATGAEGAAGTGRAPVG
jgi:hypothetical protein